MINLLEEVAESEFQSAAFLTYGVDLGFFEAKVMNRMLETGCRNAIVVADGHQAKDALNSGAQLRHVGVQCPLVTVRLGNRAFHPKAVLMVGEEKLKVLVGSGNLTLPGYARNWEMFTKLEGREAAGAALDLLGVFEDAATWSPLKPAFSAWIKRLKNSAPWLFVEEIADQPVRFLSSSVAPILPQVRKRLGGLAVDEILAASPFFDADASALRWLVDNFSPERLTLLVENGAHLDPACVGEVLEKMSGQSSVRRFVGAGRPLHGKLVLFKGSWGEALLAGSPNLSSAALLSRVGRGRGNFELATLRSGVAGEFSALLDSKIGGLVDLEHISPRTPHLIGPEVLPLELEAAWVSEGSLFAFPAMKAVRDRANVVVSIERDNHEIIKLRLQSDENRTFSHTLTDEESFQLGRTPVQARLLGSDSDIGPPIWVQNLDTIERRANPVQRPRYANGLRALENRSLGPEWEKWNSLFEAFNAFSKSWLRYADARRSRTTKPAERKTEPQSAWNPEHFYISRDEVTLELPKYFAKIENSGVAIGDFEYLIAALPSARKPVDDRATLVVESTDALAEEEPTEDEGAGASGTEDEEARSYPEVTEEHLNWLRQRLYRKFRSLIANYEDSLGAGEVQNKAEASYLCLPYPALQKALAMSAEVGLLDVWQLRELASRLTAAWTTWLWKDLPNKLDLEGRLACAATSLATVATITSPWLRQLAEVDEFDYDLYKTLREPLRELRSTFLLLEETYSAGEDSPAWEKLVGDYNQLRHVELDEKYFASWTPLQVLDDLEYRYRAWDLDEAPLWQRVADELGIEQAVQRDGDVLRVRAGLPHVGDQERFLRRLLFSIHGGTESPAAVVWDNEDANSKIKRKVMALCPELKAALEISFFAVKRPLLRLHYATGGSIASGIYLTKPKYQTVTWKRGLIYPEDHAQANLLNCVAMMLPELPIATNNSA